MKYCIGGVGHHVCLKILTVESNDALQTLRMDFEMPNEDTLRKLSILSMFPVLTDLRSH